MRCAAASRVLASAGMTLLRSRRPLSVLMLTAGLSITLVPAGSLTPAAAATSAPYTAPLRTAVLALSISEENNAGYDRDAQFGDWVDADGDCQNTRQEVLIAESLSPVTLAGSGCTVLAGLWRSVYDDQTYTSTGSIQIDHLVPVAEAWGSGAQTWTQARRVAFYNDLGNPDSLNVIASDLNAAKSARGPEQWLPPANVCTYLASWTGTKIRWQLAADPVEQAALLRLADDCPATTVTVQTADDTDSTAASSASPAASPAASPSASAPASATPPPTVRPSPAAARPQVRLSIRPERTLAGSSAVVSLRGVPGERLGLWAYTLPSQTYRLVRAGTANSQGLVSWTIRPAADTRLYGTAAGGARRSVSAVLPVTRPAAAAARAARPAPDPGIASAPTAPPVSRPLSPGNSVNCDDFASYSDAKRYFDRYYPYYGDVAELDRNGDRIPCDALPGAP